MRMFLVLTMLGLSACASGARREVAAVVQDEDARQAAATAARHGEDSKAALKAGADAAAESTDATEPPI